MNVQLARKPGDNEDSAMIPIVTFLIEPIFLLLYDITKISFTLKS